MKNTTVKLIYKELKMYLEATEQCLEENEENEFYAGYISCLKTFIEKIEKKDFWLMKE